MRKTLALILSVIMTLSVCSFVIPVSAAEGTAINTAEDFANMAAEGNYYLNADITISSTYANPFNGTFDGNGHTVTVSAPMFLDFSGTIKNLKIKGEVVCVDTNGAAVALYSTSGIVAENIVNDANVTVTGQGVYGASILANCELAEPVPTFKNIVNNGEIYVDSQAPEKPRAGGIAAVVVSGIFEECVNNAKVTVKGNIGMAAGICPRTGVEAVACTIEAIRCVNNGDIFNEDTYKDVNGVENAGTGAGDTGGIFGYVGTKNGVGVRKIIGCVNNGDIHGNYRTGGMFGYAYCSDGKGQLICVEYCINTGDIYYGRTAGTTVAGGNTYDYASGMVGYANANSNLIRFNIDTGKLIKVEGAATLNPGTSFLGCSSAPDAFICGNFVLNSDQYQFLTWASGDDNATSRVDISVGFGNNAVVPTTLEEIKSGKVCYELNKFSEENYGYEDWNFYQDLGKDEYPTVDATHGWVVLNGDKYENGTKGTTDETTAPEAGDETTAPEAGDETTKAPEAGDETTKAPEQGNQGDETTKATEQSGCGGVIAGGIALVAILGTALIIKKRD